MLHSLILPFPDFLDEILPAQIVTAHASLSHQLFLHHNLGGDTGVITAWVPQGGLASHSVPGQTGDSAAIQTHGFKITTSKTEMGRQKSQDAIEDALII